MRAPPANEYLRLAVTDLAEAGDSLILTVIGHFENGSDLVPNSCLRLPRCHQNVAARHHICMARPVGPRHTPACLSSPARQQIGRGYFSNE